MKTLIANFLTGMVLFIWGLLSGEIVMIIGGLICLTIISCSMVIFEEILKMNGEDDDD